MAQLNRDYYMQIDRGDLERGAPGRPQVSVSQRAPGGATSSGTTPRQGAISRPSTSCCSSSANRPTTQLGAGIDHVQETSALTGGCWKRAVRRDVDVGERPPTHIRLCPHPHRLHFHKRFVSAAGISQRRARRSFISLLIYI